MSVRPDQETGPVTGSAIVSDGSVAGPDQMTQGAFLDELEVTVRDVVDRELAVAGTSTRSCPYFETAMSRYRGKSPAEVEQVARRYAGVGAGGPRELIAGVAARGRLSAQRWVSDGSTDDLATALGVTQTTADATGATAVQGFDGRGARDPDPAWVRGRLGRGAPLWGPHRHAMESALGVDLGQVRVHRGGPDAALARQLGHRGFTVDQHVVVDDASLGGDPLTTSAVMAHELAHTVQQRGDGPAGTDRNADLESRADLAVSGAASVLAGDATAGAAGHGVGRARGLQLQRCEDCGGGSSSTASKPAKKSASPFSEVELAVRAAPDQTTRDTALNAGIAASRTRADSLRSTAGTAGGPVATRRAAVTAETGVGRTGSDFPTLDANPFSGRVTSDRVALAYRAWAENPTQSASPWILLAIWAKEGLTAAPTPNTVSANSTADARALYRSSYYFQNMGADHYTRYTAVAGSDNNIDLNPGAGAAHDTAFRAAITAQVTAGRLPRDISGEIDAELSVVDNGSGSYTVTATDRFYVLSLMLVDAYWRENRAGVTGANLPAGTNAGDVDALTYMRWNMGATAMGRFLSRDMSGNRDPDGTTPPIATWAFHREVRTNEYGQARANAIRFQYAADVYRMAYEGWAGSP